jgi:hypothetical protein
VLAAMTLAYSINLFGSLTHYASGQAAVFYGSGYMSLPEVRIRSDQGRDNTVDRVVSKLQKRLRLLVFLNRMKWKGALRASRTSFPYHALSSGVHCNITHRFCALQLLLHQLLCLTFCVIKSGYLLGGTDTCHPVLYCDKCLNTNRCVGV